MGGFDFANKWNFNRYQPLSVPFSSIIHFNYILVFYFLSFLIVLKLTLCAYTLMEDFENKNLPKIAPQITKTFLHQYFLFFMINQHYHRTSNLLIFLFAISFHRNLNIDFKKMSKIIPVSGIL